MERFPLALPFPDLAPIAGVRIGTASVAYKKWTRDCVTLVELTPGTVLGMVGDHEVRSPFAGILVGVLAVEGERVTTSQPIAWLRTA